jgi:hypothetical protein
MFINESGSQRPSSRVRKLRRFMRTRLNIGPAALSANQTAALNSVSQPPFSRHTCICQRETAAHYKITDFHNVV